MTIVMLLMLGTGAIMIASALDNTPIVTTFQKIITAQPININGSTTASTTSSQTTGTTPSTTLV